MNKSDVEINKDVPVTDDSYTLEEYESREVQVMAERNVELVCAYVFRDI